MIKLKSISMKNFQSIGNVTQTVKLDSDNLLLVLGENLDMGTGDYRNGTGKTSLTQAICFAIYGSPITNIRKDNLVNKINQKDMMVTLDFEVNNIQYRIERGRKPAILRFYINSNLYEDPDNEANGESKHTQEQIDKIINISPKLYKHIVSLSHKVIPFLSLREIEQREIIEELLGITVLSKKAETLNAKLKQTKDSIKEEEIRLKTIQDSNNKINSHISDLKFKSETWRKANLRNINDLIRKIEEISDIDVDLEIKNHSILKDILALDSAINSISKDIKILDSDISYIESKIKSKQKSLSHLKDKTCPECNQLISNGSEVEMEESYNKDIDSLQKSLEPKLEKLQLLGDSIQQLLDAKSEIGDKPSIVYDNLDDVYNLQRIIDSLNIELTNEKNKINPYDDQIANLTDSAIQEINYDFLNELISLKEHQEFLFKLLTKKDSFIRKKIIDQNLSFLNTRLSHYLDTINLPQTVTFNSDLSVDISKHGKEYDFDQLSTGEQNRLILSLSWAFRDIWEAFNQSMNILIVDELVDSGMDAQGVQKALEILRNFVVERNKTIFLISHKGDIENKVDNILFAFKQNEFTTYKVRDE